MGDELPPTPKPSRTQRREIAASDTLLIRDAVTRDLEPHKMPKTTLPLRLNLTVNPTDNWAVHFEPELHTQVVEQFADQLADRQVFRPGRVFCFRCASAQCEHASPDSSLRVFRGYTSTGEPAWHELAQALLEAHDERVDQLYAEGAPVVAHTQTGRNLKADQLASFGRTSKTYALLGQVTAGFFYCPQDRFAVTFQFVETRSARREVQLRINPLVLMPTGLSWEEWLADDKATWVRRSMQQTIASLSEWEIKINDAGEDRHRVARQTLSRLPALMKRFALSLERGHRQKRRRTDHSEQRRQERRPVNKALEDAHAARDDEWLLDERSDTIIVAGGQHRFHCFNEDGTHVTSFVGKPDTTAQRLRRGWWRPLEPARRETMRKQFQ